MNSWDNQVHPEELMPENYEDMPEENDDWKQDWHQFIANIVGVDKSTVTEWSDEDYEEFLTTQD